MQYYEDMLELIEDLPEEMTRRSNQIKQWDIDVTRLQRESKELQKRLFDDKISVDEKDRGRLAAELGEKQNMMQYITSKKVDLAERCERLMQSVLEKVNNGAFHFRCELEADNPGCAANIERDFYDELMDVRPLSLRFGGNFRTNSGGASPAIHSLDSFSVSSRDSDRESISENRGPSKKSLLQQMEKNRALHRSVSVSDVPSSLTSTRERGKSSIKDKTGKIGTMSRYMRKKQERQREQQKMMEKALRREQEEVKKKKRLESQVPQLDLLNFCSQSTEANGSLLREDSITPSSMISWDGVNDSKVASDMDDDFDLSDDLLNLFPDDLPSPPRDIMESLDDDSMFGLPGGGVFSGDPGPLDFGDSFGNRPMINAPAPIRSRPFVVNTPMINAPAPIRMKYKADKRSGEYNNAEKKKKTTAFGSYSDTSLHGRPIKLTGRAAEMVEQNREREKKKKDDDDEVWCTCREGSSGLMIACESGYCAIGWFHLSCVGLAEAPAGSWICRDCQLNNNNTV